MAQRGDVNYDPVKPGDVHDVLRRNVLTDGFKLVLDPVASQGSWIVDARDGRRYLDFYTFFASAPLGMNHPDLVGDPEFMAALAEVAANKPANSDIYSTHYAEFVDTFVRVLGDPRLPHLFFIEGGALAVENALKVAFDWKSRHNEANGRDGALGTRVRQAAAAFEAHPHDIAAFIAEPIQGEGGDNHMRPEFLQAMQELVHRNDALFILDEVQTGAGTTGTPWTYQQLGLEPDVVAFAKKVQVGGIMAGGRVDEVPENVFAVSGRINSTWGGGLVDMVRSRRIMEIVERDGLIAQAGPKGERLVAGLRELQSKSPSVLSNVRGRGLMIAFDLPDRRTRDTALTRLRDDESVLALPSGTNAIRFRPALNVSDEELTMGITALERVLINITKEW
jgi:L-lysine 6-transaminase